METRGPSLGRLPILLREWKRLEADDVTADSFYLRHRGHPLLGVWGIGFVQRPMTPRGREHLAQRG